MYENEEGKDCMIVSKIFDLSKIIKIDASAGHTCMGFYVRSIS